jgi:TetR/AcrR family transcriptional regulator of autoinduction and epiphytic fitness
MQGARSTGRTVVEEARRGAAGAILDAAQRLFLEAGYDEVNLNEVGRAAGVTRQTVYNQFGSKDAVFRAVVERHWTAVRLEAAAAFDGLDEAGNPEQVLHRYARALVRFVTNTEQVAFTRLVIREARRLPWIAQAFYEAGKAPLVESFAGCLDRLTARGALRCENPGLAARQFMGLLQEFIIWPQVMAIGVAAEKLPTHDVIIDEAVVTFLSRFGIEEASNAASSRLEPNHRL